jgi:hypothetical protein
MDARLPAVKILWKLLKRANALVELALGGCGEDPRVDRKRDVAYLALLDRDSVRRVGKIHYTPVAR